VILSPRDAILASLAPIVASKRCLESELKKLARSKQNNDRITVDSLISFATQPNDIDGDNLRDGITLVKNSDFLEFTGMQRARIVTEINACTGKNGI
jgi:hypothetical protein